MDEFGVPGVVLMENAGRNMAALLLSLGARGPVVLCCGRGNNGGDGFVMARHLDIARIPTRVLLFADPSALASDAAVNHTILARSDVLVVTMPPATFDEPAVRAQLAAAEWVVDALFGSGLQGPVRPPFDRIIAAINDTQARVFAVDIPSGLDADTGEPMGPTVRADHTATVVAVKQGFLAPAARDWLGWVHIIDMGAPRKLLESLGLTG